MPDEGLALGHVVLFVPLAHVDMVQERPNFCCRLQSAKWTKNGESEMQKLVVKKVIMTPNTPSQSQSMQVWHLTG